MPLSDSSTPPTVGEPLPSHVVRALAERSDGNPLFALELLHALRDEGSLDRFLSRWRV